MIFLKIETLRKITLELKRENNQAIQNTIQKLSDQLLDQYDPARQCWEGKQWMNASVTAEFLILCKYIGNTDEQLIQPALAEIRSRQNQDGGFPAYYNGPSELSISCICQLAMEIHGEATDSAHMLGLTQYISLHGGLKKAMLLPKFYNFLFGKFSVTGLPEMRPELNVVPVLAGFSVYDMASWVRSWLVPLSVVWHHEKYKNYKFWIKPYIPPLRKLGLKMARNWLLDHQEKNGSWYGVFHSTMMSMLALYNLGYSMESEEMKKAFAFILSLHDIEKDTLRQQAFLGPVWDTAFSILALEDTAKSSAIQPINDAMNYLLSKQTLKPGDWANQNKNMPGGWGFEEQNELYPDIDTTSIVLQALKKGSMNPARENSVKTGLNWLLSMQNSDGSWAAFDRNNNHNIIEWYLNLRKYNIGNGRGLVLDRGTPDLTAHAMMTLSVFGYKNESAEILKAKKWLQGQQCADGSWFGRWGLCYIYGTGGVLEALKSIGEDMTSEYVRNSVRFILSLQNNDGGFGELPEAYYDEKHKGKGPSTLTQTAWAILGLISAGETGSAEVAKGINFICNRIAKNGYPLELEYQAVAAPPMYQRYELYPYYFPLMALKKYSESIKIP